MIKYNFDIIVIPIALNQLVSFEIWGVIMTGLKRLFHLVLSVCMLVPMVGCSASGASDDKPDVLVEVGDEYYGYLTVPEGWELALPTPSPDGILPAAHVASCASPELDAFVQIRVLLDTEVEEELYTISQLYFDESGEILADEVITLDSGLLDPVYRVRAFGYGDIEKNIVYVTAYTFVGFDGLVRTVLVRATTEEFCMQLESMFEESYSFHCDPSSQPTVNINSVDRQVILDQEGVVITLLGFYEAGIARPKITFQVENNRQETIRTEGASLLINEVSFQDNFLNCYEPIAGGETCIYSIWLHLDDLFADRGIDVVERVEFSYIIIDADTKRELFRSDTITIVPLSSE